MTGAPSTACPCTSQVPRDILRAHTPSHHPTGTTTLTLKAAALPSHPLLSNVTKLQCVHHLVHTCHALPSAAHTLTYPTTQLPLFASHPVASGTVAFINMYPPSWDTATPTDDVRENVLEALRFAVSHGHTQDDEDHDLLQAVIAAEERAKGHSSYSGSELSSGDSDNDDVALAVSAGTQAQRRRSRQRNSGSGEGGDSDAHSGQYSFGNPSVDDNDDDDDDDDDDDADDDDDDEEAALARAIAMSKAEVHHHDDDDAGDDDAGEWESVDGSEDDEAHALGNRPVPSSLLVSLHRVMVKGFNVCSAGSTWILWTWHTSCGSRASFTAPFLWPMRLTFATGVK